MPKIYYCEYCHKFEDREGFRFEVIRTKPSKYCCTCKNKCRVFEVDHTNWVKIGTPIGIIFGILVFIYLEYRNYFSPLGTPEIDIFWGTLFFIICSILIVIGVAGGFSLMDPEAAAKKILKEHPELEEKKIKIKL
jgi:hypothetical protein